MERHDTQKYPPKAISFGGYLYVVKLMLFHHAARRSFCRLCPIASVWALSAIYILFPLAVRSVPFFGVMRAAGFAIRVSNALFPLARADYSVLFRLIALLIQGRGAPSRLSRRS